MCERVPRHCEILEGFWGNFKVLKPFDVLVNLGRPLEALGRPEIVFLGPWKSHAFGGQLGPICRLVPKSQPCAQETDILCISFRMAHFIYPLFSPNKVLLLALI